LPISLQSEPKNYLLPKSEATYSFDDFGSTSPQEDILKNSYTPIQFAAFYGHISCIRIIQLYFADKITPYWMEINFQDLITGENCALLACRSGSYAMVRYLFNTCHANFKVLNTSNENALQVLLCENKSKRFKDSLQITKFLIENIGIEYLQAIEETLDVCEDPAIIEYLCQKCAEQGLEVNKKSFCITEVLGKLQKQEELSNLTDKSIPSLNQSHPSTISYINARGSNISNFLTFVNAFLKP